jgi:uncharacterized protein YodC (DUF2158 family)
MLLLSPETDGLSVLNKEADLFKLGNLVRHRSGGPIMVVDQDVLRSSVEPKVYCAWTEAGERHHASFQERELQAVHGDGTPRNYSSEE